MLFDKRTYRCRPGTIKKHLELYLQYGWEPQRRNLGEPYFYGMTETGDPNAFVHIWQYENAGDREQRRANMQADPDWQEYLRISSEAGYLVSQENTLLIPAPFFTPR